MKIYRDDLFLWNTICEVTSDNLQVRELIYAELEGNIWSIDKIERLEKKYI